MDGLQEPLSAQPQEPWRAITWKAETNSHSKGATKPATDIQTDTANAGPPAIRLPMSTQGAPSPKTAAAPQRETPFAFA